MSLIIGTCIFTARVVEKAVSMANQPKVEGTLSARGGERGDLTLRLTSCQAGEAQGFFGVDLFAEGDRHSRVRLLKDPIRGNVVTVTLPAWDRALVLDTSKCKVLEGDVTRHGYANGHTTLWAFDGQLHFDCQHVQGVGHLVGAMTFHDCF